MDVLIRLLSDTGIDYQELADMIHAAFEERLHQGLRFTCSAMTAGEFEVKMKGGYVFVALDNDSGKLLGTVTIHVRTDKKGRIYGYHEYLAVAPEAKHSGVGTKLAQAWTELLLDKNAKYVLSDTACKAESSVRWHLSNGFRIYELESYRSTDYWSYVFIKYLDDDVRKSCVGLRLHFYLSWIFIRTTRHRNGSDTALGKLYKRIWAK